MLDEIIKSAIHTVCRALSVPQTPESASLRVFIFRKVDGELVCSHAWAPNPTKEVVGKLRFKLDSKVADVVAVVRTALRAQTVKHDAVVYTTVSPIPEGLAGVIGDVDPDLKFVVAAPIFNQDGSVWGVVDFDASNDTGAELLKTEVSEQVMFQLTKMIEIILGLDNSVERPLGTI
jgi:hypothetical protein